jgi:restriction system protein
MSRRKRLVDADKLTLEQWLDRSFVHRDDRDYTIADYQFPTAAHRDEYLRTVHLRPESEVKNLLRLFLMPGGTLGADTSLMQFWLQTGKIVDLVERTEFAKRFLNSDRHNWESNSWILDLLPNQPESALSALDAYVMAHIAIMPDGRLTGHNDAMAIIRTRYLERQAPRDSLMALGWRNFELLVAEVYRRLGFDVRITKPRKDGGLDIELRRLRGGLSEASIVECKRHSHKPNVKDVRALLGVVSDRKVNKGIIVSTSTFTSGARELSSGNRRIELVPYSVLNRLLNRAFGPEWPQNIAGNLWWINRLEQQSPGAWHDSGKRE